MHLDREIQQTGKHVVVLTDPVIVELPDPSLSQRYQEGVYLFSNKKKAKRFTTLCNGAIDDALSTVAILFESDTIKETEK